jgi:hypothetical protein
MCWPQIARDVDLHEQIGKDIFFDLVDHDKVRSFRIQKQTPFIIFKVWPILLCNECTIMNLFNYIYVENVIKILVIIV